jgi:hypothetical protein
VRGKCLAWQLGRRAAYGAEPVRAVPVQQSDEIGRKAPLVLRQHHARLAQRGQASQTGLGDIPLGLRVVEVGAEQGASILESEQDRLIGIHTALERATQQ